MESKAEYTATVHEVQGDVIILSVEGADGGEKGGFTARYTEDYLRKHGWTGDLPKVGDVLKYEVRLCR